MRLDADVLRKLADGLNALDGLLETHGVTVDDAIIRVWEEGDDFAFTVRYDAENGFHVVDLNL